MAERDATGGCMCGAVRFRATGVPDAFGACHCEMCRRWTGSALLAVTIPTRNVVWEGAEHIARTQSSILAERAWCGRCGSGLYFRVTADSPYSEDTEIPLGLFDEPDGFRMTHEIWIDGKPDSYGYAGTDRKILTRQDCIEKFPPLAGI